MIEPPTVTPVRCERHGVTLKGPGSVCLVCRVDGYGKRTAGAFVRDVGDQVKLRLDFMRDDTPPPEEGDELRTIGGRRYLVLGRRGKTITAVVLPANAPPVPGRLLSWHWSPRKGRA